MTAQQSDSKKKEDELILFDNVLVPNIDNELVFGLGDDSYVNSLDWDGGNISFNHENNADPDQQELQNLLLDLDDDLPCTTFSSSAPSIMDASNNPMHTESVNYRVTTAPQTKTTTTTTTITPSAEIIPKSVGSSRAATEMTNFKNNNNNNNNNTECGNNSKKCRI